MAKAKLTTTISKEEKEAIRLLIEKGMFESYSDFGRRAVARFLRDIEEYAEKKGVAVSIPKAKKDPEKREDNEEEKRVKDAEDIARFADSLF
jgi:Arc/MetJ-type ribon-helix-helix transcriptional regulator